MGKIGNPQKESLFNLKKQLPEKDISFILDELYKLVPEDHLENKTLLLLRGRYNTYKRDSLSGILLGDEKYKNESLIRSDLLDYINLLIQDIPYPTNENTEKLADSLSKADLVEFGTFTDPRDGQKYKTVELNSLVWMAENLNYQIGHQSWYYKNDILNGKRYGLLYNWDGAKEACPTGWRLPTEKEWMDLIKSSGGYYDKIINAGTPIKIGDDPERAFDVLQEKLNISNMGGYRDPNGEFGNPHIVSFWSSEIQEHDRLRVNFDFNNDKGLIYKTANPRLIALSCRCVRDLNTSNLIDTSNTKLILPKEPKIETPRLSFEPEMVFVQGGTFQMGSNDYDSGKPIHDVTVKDFYIGKYPVTQAQWRAVMGSDPPVRFKGCDECPVENVSGNDTQEFIKQINEKTGKNYRLPSETEWEYAARGGKHSKGFIYAGSNNLDEVGWYYGNSNRKTHPVGEKKATELGIYDMSGNVGEWCADVWHDNYDGAPKDGSAWMSDGNQDKRVVRGGSWLFNDNNSRVSYRISSNADSRSGSIGFRLAGY